MSCRLWALQRNGAYLGIFDSEEKATEARGKYKDQSCMSVSELSSDMFYLDGTPEQVMLTFAYSGESGQQRRDLVAVVSPNMDLESHIFKRYCDDTFRIRTSSAHAWFASQTVTINAV